MNTTNEAAILKLASIAAGVIIVETCLVLGVDGAGMLIGGTLLGLPIGATVEGVLAATFAKRRGG